jgi:hypothetical protein
MADSVTDEINYVGLKGNSGDSVTYAGWMGNTKVTLQPNNGMACDGVTDKTPITGSNSAINNDIEVMRF